MAHRRREERIAVLEEDLENAGIAHFLQDRLAQTTGERLSAEEFLRGIGMDRMIAYANAASRLTKRMAEEGF